MKQGTIRQETIINFTAQYVHDHISEPLTIELLAAKTGMSKYHLSRLFHAATGFPLGEYVQRRRLEHAYLLLSSTGQSIMDVALAVGYDSHSAFSRAFRKAFRRQPVDVSRGELPSFEPLQLIKQTARPEVRPELVNLEQQVLVGLYGAGFRQQSFTELSSGLYAGLAAELGFSNGFDYSRHRLVGVSLDSPWRGEQDTCRFFAGLAMPANDTNAHLPRYYWSAGTWARFVHTGPYYTMWQTISRIYAGWVIPNDIPLRDAEILQHYLNSPHSTPQEKLETHLYFPLDCC